MTKIINNTASQVYLVRLILILLLVSTININAQEIEFVDNKGTMRTFKENKSYVQTYTSHRRIEGSNAVILNTFPELTIQSNKNIRLDIYIPTRSLIYSFDGGLFVNVLVQINDATWYNLGNTGYDGGSATSGSFVIHSLNHEMLLDFIGNLDELNTIDSYTIKFKLSVKSTGVYINSNHEINRTAQGLDAHLPLQTWASDQNYCHLIITEMER